MVLKDIFRYLVGAYYGVREMDEFATKEYILNDIEKYIRDFISSNDLNDINLKEESSDVEDNVPLKNKLQDALIVLPKVEAPLELILLIKKRLKSIREEELENM